MTPGERAARARTMRLADTLIADALTTDRPAPIRLPVRAVPRADGPLPDFDAVIDRALPRPRAATGRDRAAAAGFWVLHLMGRLVALGVIGELARGVWAIWRGAAT